jgi:hypothetical protein
VYVLLTGQYVVGAVGRVPQVVVEPVGQVEPAGRLDLGEVGDEVTDRTGVPRAAGAKAERAAQLVVVPGDHTASADASDGGRREDRCRRLVHAALGVGEREDPRTAEIAAQHRGDLLDRAARVGRLPLDHGSVGDPAVHPVCTGGRERPVVPVDLLGSVRAPA